MKFLIFLIYFFSNIFFKKFKNYHMSVYYRATWQFTIITRGSGNSCFQFSIPI